MPLKLWHKTREKNEPLGHKPATGLLYSEPFKLKILDYKLENLKLDSLSFPTRYHMPWMDKCAIFDEFYKFGLQTEDPYWNPVLATGFVDFELVNHNFL